MADLSQDTEPDIEKVRKELEKRLTSEWQKSSMPKGLVNARMNAHLAPEENTARIFIDSGFPAWFAYFCLTQERKARHHAGQVNTKRTLDALEKLSATQKKDIAAQLVQVQPHNTVVTAINDYSQRQKRPRLEQQSLSPSLSPTTPNMQLSGETRSSPRQEAAQTQPSRDREAASPPTETQFSPDQETVYHPMTKRLNSVFPPYLCGAIRKWNDKSDVTIAFPSSFSSLDCVISLYISANKVQYLAMELFGIHLETEGMFRYIFLPNGSRLRPDDVILQGADQKAINRILGSDICGAIERCPLRQEEVRLAIYRTECVSLRLTKGSTDDVMMTITVELDDGFRFKEALFK